MISFLDNFCLQTKTEWFLTLPISQFDVACSSAPPNSNYSPVSLQLKCQSRYPNPTSFSALPSCRVFQLLVRSLMVILYLSSLTPVFHPCSVPLYGSKALHAISPTNIWFLVVVTFLWTRCSTRFFVISLSAIAIGQLRVILLGHSNIICMGVENDKGLDHVTKSMLDTQYTWINRANCHVTIWHTSLYMLRWNLAIGSGHCQFETGTQWLYLRWDLASFHVIGLR